MAINKNAVKAVIEKAIKAKRSALTADECKKICAAYDIPLPRDGLATSGDKAASLAKRLGFPVVMKIQSGDILHKTDAGGVIVGVNSAAEAKKAYNTILKNAKAYNKKARIDGVQVQKMLSSQGAQEVLVGAVTDPSFGKLVAFGLGGVLVEIMKDITFRLAPATKKDAMSMLQGIQGAEILKGVRGADAGRPSGARHDHPERVEAGLRLPGDRGDGPQPDLRAQKGRDRCRRAHSPRPQAEARALPPVAASHPGRDEAHHEPGFRGGHRRVGRRRQDRQLGHEESDQRRLQGKDLSDQSARRRSARLQVLQEREGHSGHGRRRRLRHPGEVRHRGARGSRPEERFRAR